MNREQVVSFNTAKLAKDKGFKIGWNPFGYVDKFYRPSTGTLLNYGRTGNSKMDDLIYAPPQSILQKWLREEKSIDVEARATKHTGGDIASYYQYYINGNLVNMEMYTTYEGALEAGIYEVLNKLK